MTVYLRVRLTRVKVRQAALKRLAEHVLVVVGEKQSELSIDLVGDARMRRLNHQYRKKDRTTDVLAFAMRESGSPVSALLGDVVISVPTAQRQAKEGGRSLSEELAWLLVHGVLHLCGYDHERSDAEARRMKRREQAVLRVLRPIPTLATVPLVSRIRAGVTTTRRR
ncbi:rRNA maturation RNase YbeY [Nitrospira lenta]|nr:rRNA maturation RNase YbeY [Nitrospira lenta]